MDGLTHLAVDAFTWQVHGWEIAREITDLVSILIMTFHGILTYLPIVLALVL